MLLMVLLMVMLIFLICGGVRTHNDIGILMKAKEERMHQGDLEKPGRKGRKSCGVGSV